MQHDERVLLKTCKKFLLKVLSEFKCGHEHFYMPRFCLKCTFKIVMPFSFLSGYIETYFFVSNYMQQRSNKAVFNIIGGQCGVFKLKLACSKSMFSSL